MACRQGFSIHEEQFPGVGQERTSIGVGTRDYIRWTHGGCSRQAMVADQARAVLFDFGGVLLWEISA